MSRLPGRHAVFVDPTGKRRRLVRWAGVTVGSLLAAYLAIVTFGLVTGGGAPLAPWPDAKPSHHDAAPREGAPLRPRSSSSVSKRPTVNKSPGTTAHHAPATTQPATTAPTTAHPGRGRAFGLTKSPNAKKP
jgi:hypothetical protein